MKKIFQSANLIWLNLPLNSKGLIIVVIPVMAYVLPGCALLLNDNSGRPSKLIIEASLAGGFLGLLAAARLFTTGIASRIAALQETAIHLARGMAVSLPQSAKDEIGKLTESLVETARVLDERETEIEDRSWKLLESERALGQETRLLQCVLNSTAEGVIAADENGKFILANPAARELLGLDIEGTAFGRWAASLACYHPDRVTPYRTEDLPLVRAMRGEITENLQMFLCSQGRPDGVWLSISGRPLISEEHALRGAVIVMRDINEAKRAEAVEAAAREAEAANRAKTEFLSRMSHELRTPLNAILGFAQLLELEPLTPSQSESVDQILKGGQHLLDLINEVLDIARIEAGRLQLSSEPLQVQETIETVMGLMEPLAAQQKVELRLEASTDWGSYIVADRQRFQQVAMNLLSNSIKYNRKGGAVTLRCKVAQPSRIRLAITDTGSTIPVAQAGRLRILFSDEGAGIPSDRLHLLFRPFERLDAAQSGVEGTGIGLALSKRLVEAMGGEIGVETQAGAGSTFWIEFPMSDAPLKLTKPAASSEPVCDQTLSTVLYIEDNTSNCVLMRKILAGRHIKLIQAVQGRLGLELARNHRPDLILLDLHLPDLPGDEVLREIRGIPELSATPVAVITADASPGQADRVLSLGAQAYLTKPLNVKQFLEFIDKTLSVGA